MQIKKSKVFMWPQYASVGFDVFMHFEITLLVHHSYYFRGAGFETGFRTAKCFPTDDEHSKCLDKTDTPTSTTQQHLLVDATQKTKE